ncbi:MAG: sulfatase-like hydrolase/transferase [Vicinamibacteria bacterium]
MMKSKLNNRRPVLRGVVSRGIALAFFCGACAREGSPPPLGSSASVRPSILLVTLDTTRADSIGPGAVGIETPAFNALVARGQRFTRAYAAVPETLPSHTSMMTGLYPAGHGIHENARTVPAQQSLLAEQLQRAGYRTAAFVSSFVLARRFGLGRGFDLYDDIESPERSALETTNRAIESLNTSPSKPQFLWVHYFDAHAPYTPPEPYRSRFVGKPYLGEIAAVDEQLGRLVAAFEQKTAGPVAIVVVGDHGEGLGDHGESQHGNLVYEATMHVPLVMAGSGISKGVAESPVSTRRIFNTILDLAGINAAGSLRAPTSEIVLGEAMKPFLEYGWQPQVMAVEGAQKVITAGRSEVYDVVADPGETQDLSATANLSRPLRTAMTDYPVPAAGVARAPGALSDEDRKKLASLGYVSAGAAPVIRKDAPRPVGMVRLFDTMEKASGLFVGERYAQVIPLLEKILSEDPHNLDAILRLASAHSALGQNDAAMRAFEKAKDIAPASEDVRVYLALHLARGKTWEEAVPLLENIVKQTPDRVPAVEALAQIRERQGRLQEAIALRKSLYALRNATPMERIKLGQMAMDIEDTPLAIESFEAARAAQGTAFKYDLELGVLYLASRRFEDARTALDRVPSHHPAYAMALFKRAQVSVLLKEPDQAARIEAARRRADATTRPLIERERLFQSR